MHITVMRTDYQGLSRRFILYYIGQTRPYRREFSRQNSFNLLVFLWSQQVFLHQAIYDRERKPESRFTFKLPLRQYCTHACFLQISLQYNRRGCNISAPVKSEKHARRTGSDGLQRFFPCPDGHATSAADMHPSRNVSVCDEAETLFFRRSTDRAFLQDWLLLLAQLAQSRFSDKKILPYLQTDPMLAQFQYSFFPFAGNE